MARALVGATQCKGLNGWMHACVCVCERIGYLLGLYKEGRANNILAIYVRKEQWTNKNYTCTFSY